jgi:hypothetical protein
MFNSNLLATQNPMLVSGSSTGIYSKSGLYRDSTAFDGMSLIFTGGTVTGTMKVYGYN